MKLAVLYRWLLGLGGVAVILWGFYTQCYPIISTGTLVTSGPSVTYYFTRMTYLPFFNLVLFAILYNGLGYICMGVLLLGLSTLRAGIAYWSIQVTLWIAAIAFWYHYAFLAGSVVYTNLWPYHASTISLLPWLGGALVCSFILTGLYRQVNHFLQHMFGLISAAGNQT